MSLPAVLALILFALLAGWVVPSRWRGWVLMAGSLAAVYALQPSSPIRNLDFWLPTAAISLTIFVWAATRPPETENHRSTLISALLILTIVIAISLTRYLGSFCCLTPNRPPELVKVILAIGLAGGLIFIPYRLLPNRRALPAITILVVLILFIMLKTEPLTRAASAGLRFSTGQAIDLASAADLAWLGFSYLAFRLLHVLRDYQTGKLPGYSLSEFVNYALFFPAYTAGPIDRIQRFANDLRKPFLTNSPNSAAGPTNPAPTNLLVGGSRIVFGIFKKFALADGLALLALSGQNAMQVDSGLWAWALLYAYALRIYLDFSGYTDIAIGMGYLMGFKIPENFDQPYLKQSLTSFWNSWHITLAQWFRAYFFYPVTRALRTRFQAFPPWGIILIGQIVTMVLIGLWHGITWNFAIWGAWHGIGLFINNRWSEWTRPRMENLETRPWLKHLLGVSGWLLTFHYVTLGWVWFALPTPASSWKVFLQLFGF